jgi:hypothetical protein
VFALNGMEPEQHGRPGPPGGVVYFSPSTLSWDDLELGHSQWLTWLLDGGAAGHYHDVLWPTWRTEVAELGLRDGILGIPVPVVGGGAAGHGSDPRKAVPLAQILDLQASFCGQLGLGEPGELGTVGV